jgi:site-specific recombinase XerC
LRFALTTTGNIVGSVRRFFRFLHATGRLRHELASSIQCSVRRRSTPPRTLPWSDVTDCAQIVRRDWQRDYAILLLMNLYGRDRREVRSLTLIRSVDLLDFTVVRPKTGGDSTALRLRRLAHWRHIAARSASDAPRAVRSSPHAA